MTSANNVNLFEMFSTDKESEEDGRWIELGETTKIKVRAMGSKAVTDLRDILMRPYQAILRAGAKIPDDKNEEVGLRVISGAVIADWQGVNNAEGVEVPYSESEAYAICKAIPKFANMVAQVSMDAQMYRDDLREDAAKN